MKRFMALHIGFEKPTPEIMSAWKAWFASVADHTIENVGLAGGREITKEGTTELQWNRESLTGYSIIEAESLDAAGQMASGNPFITSIRIYELRNHG